ncbi:MAG: hypothetical protein OEY55_01140 [Acidimicrobiia bacterium]|nr:hypothetical protein [Acidimicrobiia bacterium]MDH5420388.1 hypothetical protein [Acidimicrobiia bacterium]MDH5504763.1 hypothetical protein [Acidimicrobiia bacterium]
MDSTFIASRPAGRTRRPKTYTADRVCADVSCETVLSRYNKREACHVHAPVKFPRIRGRFEDAE